MKSFFFLSADRSLANDYSIINLKFRCEIVIVGS